MIGHSSSSKFCAFCDLRTFGDRPVFGKGNGRSGIRRIPHDQRFAGPFLFDLRTAQEQARKLITTALLFGYKSQVEGTPLNGAKLIFIMDAQTKAALDGYPILGETAAEHAAAIAEALRRDAMRAVGMPLTGQADFHLVASALGIAGQAHADRVAAGVAEAYFAGVQAGLIDATKALVGGK